MIAFMGIEYTEDGVLYFVNVGEKSVWSKFVSWLQPQRLRDMAEAKQRRIASGYLAEAVKKEIKKLKH